LLLGSYEQAKSCSDQHSEHRTADDVEWIVDADVDAGERDRRSEEIEQRREAGEREGENRRRRKARGRVP
jgi:hypothetical protein